METKPSYAELERRIERLDQAESALKQAQEALSKSEEMCRLLLERGVEGILITQEGKIRFLNPRGLAFIGYSLEEMLSQDMLAFIHPDDRGWIAPLCLAKLAGEDVPSGRCFRVIHKNGSVRWVQSRSTLLDWEGKPALLSFLTNVEDRKRAEEKYRLLVENAGEAIYVAQAGKLTFVNKKTMEISGYSEQELISRPFVDFIHPDDRSMVLDRHMRRQRGEGLPSCYSFRIVQRSGQIRWVELRVVAIEWEGKPATLNFLADITERKQAEDALRASQERFRLAFHTSPDGICLTRASDGRFIDVNDGVSLMSGYAREELLQTSARELNAWIDPADRERIVEALTPGGKVVNYEAGFRKKDGSARTCSVSASFLVLDGTECILWVARDITEKKQAEKALRESTERLRLALQVAHIGYWVYDAAAQRIEWTGGEGSLSGSYASDFRGTLEDAVSMIHPEDRHLATEAIHRALEEKVPLDITHRALFPDGITRWLRSFGYLSMASPDQPAGIFGITIDITDLKTAEERWKHERDFLRLLIDLIPGFVSVKGRDGRYRLANEAVARAYGTTVHEVEGKTDADFSATKDQVEGYRLNDREVFERRQTKIIEEQPITHADGSIHWLKTVKVPLIGKDGACKELLAVSTDITDRKCMEDALRESELFLKEIQRIARLGGWKANPHTGYLAWTDGAYDIMEADPNHQPGFTDGFQFFLPDCAASIREKVIACMATGEPFVMECQLVTESDKQLWTEFRGLAPVTEGERSYVIGTIQDITERKRALQEDERLRAQFLQAQKMESVGRLAGGVAHDFNNSLQMILGYAELALMKAEKSEKIHAEIEEIKRATTRATNIVRQLLAFARKQTIAPEALDVNDTVGGMLKMLRRLIGEDIDLTWIPGPDLWQVQMDPSQVDQILANLCVNARDAISGVGKVTVETCNAVLDRDYCQDHIEAVPGQYVLLAVGDDGCGMDRDVLAQIFEPFFTTKEAAKGTGLGLATVYGIVKQNNGYIEVQSEPGKGSVFKVFLPRHEGEEETSAAAPGSGDALATGTETVLLVEDQGPVLELGRRLLVELGYTVLAASTPDEALHLAEAYAEQIHLLLTDVVLPKMNGRDLAIRLASLRPGLKCLFMSGHTANVIAHRGILEKGVHFIQKPFAIKDLSTKIREVLEQT